MAKKEARGYEIGGLAFIGSIMLGIGLGILFSQVVVGVLGGIGVGFIVMAIFRAIVKN